MKILLALITVLAAFLIYVASKPNHFRYVKSGVIHAPAEKIYPFISQLRMGKQWSPYEQKDPNMKETFSETDGELGSTLEFEGNSNVGSGKIEILKLIPNELVQMRLTMLKPMKGENLIEYKLTPVPEGTLFSWSMEGESNFLMKIVSVFIDCEKMLTDDFSLGIQNLKTKVEGQK